MGELASQTHSHLGPWDQRQLFVWAGIVAKKFPVFGNDTIFPYQHGLTIATTKLSSVKSLVTHYFKIEVSEC